MRYILKARGINIFKDGRSFSTVSYAKIKLKEIGDLLAHDEVVEIVEVKDSADIAREKIEDLEHDLCTAIAHLRAAIRTKDYIGFSAVARDHCVDEIKSFIERFDNNDR